MFTLKSNYYKVPKTGRIVGRTSSGHYMWASKDGSEQRVKDLDASHLFYAARMIWNHSVPPAYRILGHGEIMKRYEDIFERSTDDKVYSFNILMDELDRREFSGKVAGLPDNLQEQLEDLAGNLSFLKGILADFF